MSERRIIDAYELFDELQKLDTLLYSNGLENRLMVDLNQVEALIDKQPTAKEKLKGEWWVDVKDRMGGCSECKFVTDIFYTGLWRFCPNCGADMRGEGE